MPLAVRTPIGLEYRLDQSPTKDAPVVLLLHGLGSCGEDWALQRAADEPARWRSLIAVNAFARLRATRGSLRRGIERTWLAATGQMDELGRRVADGLFPDGGQEAFRAAAAARLAGNRALPFI